MIVSVALIITLGKKGYEAGVPDSAPIRDSMVKQDRTMCEDYPSQDYPSQELLPTADENC